MSKSDDRGLNADELLSIGLWRLRETGDQNGTQQEEDNCDFHGVLQDFFWTSSGFYSLWSEKEKRAPLLDRSLESLQVSGEPSRTRTCDPLVKSQLLYQLSYRPTLFLEV